MMQQPNIIKFYSEKDSFGELSNYYLQKTPIKWRGKPYASGEHLYQAMKFTYPSATKETLKYADVIRTINTPNKAKMLARQKEYGTYKWQKDLCSVIREFKEKANLNPNWEQEKDEYMLLCLRLKFRADEHCHNILTNTRDAELVEHTARDKYWGDGGDGSGENKLGKLLVKVRGELEARATEAAMKRALSTS